MGALAQRGLSSRLVPAPGLAQQGRGAGARGSGALTRRSLRSRAARDPARGCARAGRPGGAGRRRGRSPSRAGSGAAGRAPGWRAVGGAAARGADPPARSGAGTSRRTWRGGRGLPAGRRAGGGSGPGAGPGRGGGYPRTPASRGERARAAWAPSGLPSPVTTPRSQGCRQAHFTGKQTEASRSEAARPRPTGARAGLLRPHTRGSPALATGKSLPAPQRGAGVVPTAARASRWGPRPQPSLRPPPAGPQPCARGRWEQDVLGGVRLTR